MWFLAQQSFMEAVDGVRSLFTTAQNYVEGKIWIYQGNFVVEPDDFFQITPNLIRFMDINTADSWELDPGNPETILLSEHGFSDDDELFFWSTEQLPDGLLQGISYFVKVVDDHRFQVAASVGGDAIPIVNGDGEHWLAFPVAPDPQNGSLWYNAYIAEGATSAVLADGLWIQDDFITLFNITPETFGFSSDAEAAAAPEPGPFAKRVAYSLHAASVLVRAYLATHDASDMYADAKSLTPMDVTRTEMFRYIEALLTFKMLLEEPGVIGKGPISEHIEKFTDAIQITKRYQSYGANKITTIIKQESQVILETFLSQFVTQIGVLTPLPYMVSKQLPEAVNPVLESMIIGMGS